MEDPLPSSRLKDSWDIPLDTSPQNPYDMAERESRLEMPQTWVHHRDHELSGIRGHTCIRSLLGSRWLNLRRFRPYVSSGCWWLSCGHLGDRSEDRFALLSALGLALLFGQAQHRARAMVRLLVTDEDGNHESRLFRLGLTSWRTTSRMTYNEYIRPDSILPRNN
jgi:hypothetical protein